jgi:hypothetical protein
MLAAVCEACDGASWRGASCLGASCSGVAAYYRGLCSLQRSLLTAEVSAHCRGFCSLQRSLLAAKLLVDSIMDLSQATFKGHVIETTVDYGKKGRVVGGKIYPAVEPFRGRLSERITAEVTGHCTSLR